MSNPLEGIQLAAFYSSLAEVMLAQFENFNRLIGHTSHQTHSGTLCEVLLRETLRSFLSADYSLDKGFVFGRRAENDTTYESPEIDIVIHTTRTNPVFRLDDLVIVQGESVRGVIQVKKTLDDGAFRKGISNVFTAMKHLAAMCRHPDDVLRRCCSMVVAFNPILPSTTVLRSALVAAIGQELPVQNHRVAVMMPNLIGSIQSGMYVKTFSGGRAWYFKYPSIVEGKNYFVQMMLHLIDVTIFQGMSNMPIEFPDAFPRTRELQVYGPPEEISAENLNE